MTAMQMPAPRDFGWEFKPTSSSHFVIHRRDNGQFCVVLNHALLRGCSAEMIHWWFLHFANLKVTLEDVPGYEGRSVPAYLLWHPIDHVSATLAGELGPDGSARPGATIRIREAMQYDTHGWRYPVDTKLRILYVGGDGWAMGKVLPALGPVMVLRVHFRDVHENRELPGVHYHYEVVIGATARHPLARWLNQRIAAKFGPEFFAAWHRHNVIEVGTFENFLPPLHAQRADVRSLTYGRGMDPRPPSPTAQEGIDRALFAERAEGFARAADPYAFQAFDRPSFL